MSLHIIDSDNKFLVIEVFSYKNRIYSKIHSSFKLLDLAEKYVKVLAEDAVPVNSVQGGNVSNFTPLLLRKIGKKKLTKYMQTRNGLK